MRSLISLIYASRSTEYFHEHEIPDLLQQARVANARQEITGMLLYVDGSYTIKVNHEGVHTRASV